MPDPIDPHHLRDPFRSLSRSGEPLLHMKLATVPKRRLALGREAAVLRTLRHPNAVELIEFREESLPGESSLATRHVGPATLAHAFGTPQALAHAAASFLRVVLDLHASGWSHGQLRSDHVLIEPGGRMLLCSWSEAQPLTAAPTQRTSDMADTAAILLELCERSDARSRSLQRDLRQLRQICGAFSRAPSLTQASSALTALTALGALRGDSPRPALFFLEPASHQSAKRLQASTDRHDAEVSALFESEQTTVFPDSMPPPAEPSGPPNSLSRSGRGSRAGRGSRVGRGSRLGRGSRVGRGSSVSPTSRTIQTSRTSRTLRMGQPSKSGGPAPLHIQRLRTNRYAGAAGSLGLLLFFVAGMLLLRTLGGPITRWPNTDAVTRIGDTPIILDVCVAVIRILAMTSCVYGAAVSVVTFFAAATQRRDLQDLATVLTPHRLRPFAALLVGVSLVSSAGVQPVTSTRSQQVIDLRTPAPSKPAPTTSASSTVAPTTPASSTVASSSSTPSTVNASHTNASTTAPSPSTPTTSRRPRPDRTESSVSSNASGDQRAESSESSEFPDSTRPDQAGDGLPDLWLIKSGDHLWGIADRALSAHLGRAATEDEIDPYWRATVELNRGTFLDEFNPDFVVPGQVIELPPFLPDR